MASQILYKINASTLANATKLYDNSGNLITSSLFVKDPNSTQYREWDGSDFIGGMVDCPNCLNPTYTIENITTYTVGTEELVNFSWQDHSGEDLTVTVLNNTNNLTAPNVDFTINTTPSDPATIVNPSTSDNQDVGITFTSITQISSYRIVLTKGSDSPNTPSNWLASLEVNIINNVQFQSIDLFFANTSSDLCTVPPSIQYFYESTTTQDFNWIILNQKTIYTSLNADPSPIGFYTDNVGAQTIQYGSYSPTGNTRWTTGSVTCGIA